jgi:hypothetical protein
MSDIQGVSGEIKYLLILPDVRYTGCFRRNGILVDYS